MDLVSVGVTVDTVSVDVVIVGFRVDVVSADVGDDSITDP